MNKEIQKYYICNDCISLFVVSSVTYDVIKSNGYYACNCIMCTECNTIFRLINSKVRYHHDIIRSPKYGRCYCKGSASLNMIELTDKESEIYKLLYEKG